MFDLKIKKCNMLKNHYCSSTNYQ